MNKNKKIFTTMVILFIAYILIGSTLSYYNLSKGLSAIREEKNYEEAEKFCHGINLPTIIFERNYVQLFCDSTELSSRVRDLRAKESAENRTLTDIELEPINKLCKQIEEKSKGPSFGFIKVKHPNSIITCEELLR